MKNRIIRFPATNEGVYAIDMDEKKTNKKNSKTKKQNQ